MKSSLWILSFLCFTTYSCKQEVSIETLQTTITNLNRRMEKAYNNGDLKKVAQFYTDDAWLLGPGGYQKQGRKAIDNYWTNISQPIRWKLSVIKLAKTEAELYETDYWQKLKNKPPHWRDIGLNLPGDDSILYQLGHSKLEYEGEDATHQVSHADFIILWQKQTDGKYRILVDTYVMN